MSPVCTSMRSDLVPPSINIELRRLHGLLGDTQVVTLVVANVDLCTNFLSALALVMSRRGESQEDGTES